MSNTSGIESFDSELIRAFLNSQVKTPEGGALAAAKLLIESKLKGSTSEASGDKVTSQLLILLNKLEVNSQIIDQLKKSLTEINNPRDVDFKKLSIPDEEAFKNPEKLLVALKSYKHETILKEIKLAKEAITSSTESPLEARETVEKIERHIKAVLKDLRPLHQEKGISNLYPEKIVLKQSLEELPSKAISVEKVLSFERALEKLNGSDELGALRKASERLMLLLNTVSGRKDLPLEAEKKLNEAIKLQIELLKNIEEPVKRLLISPSSEGQLSTLLRVLEGLRVDELPAENELQVKYKEFITDLTLKLKELLFKLAPEKEIKDFLLKVLDQIYSDFKLEPLEKRLRKESQVDKLKDFLKPEQIINLKLIEAQIAIILNSPKESIFEQIKSESSNEVKLQIKSAELRNLLVLLEKTEAKDIADKLKPLVQECLKTGTMPEAADREIRKLLKEVIESGLIKNTIDRALESKSQQVDEKQTLQLKLIVDLIKEVLGEEISFKAGGLSEALALDKIISSPSYKSLIQLLKKIDQSLPSPNSAFQNEFVEFSSGLLEKLDIPAKTANIAKLFENLNKAMERLEIKFIPALVPEKETTLGSLNLSALRNLESTASSQEVLQKLNPAMKAAGEPVTLLFPFAMQGILSRLEVSFGGKVLEKEKRKSKKKNKSNAYQTIKFSLGLPNLGDVYSSIIYNDSEFLMLMDFDNALAAAKVEPSLQHLETGLRAMGFDKVSVSLRSEGLFEKTPDWISKLLRNL